MGKSKTRLFLLQFNIKGDDVSVSSIEFNDGIMGIKSIKDENAKDILNLISRKTEGETNENSDN